MLCLILTLAMVAESEPVTALAGTINNGAAQGAGESAGTSAGGADSASGADLTDISAGDLPAQILSEIEANRSEFSKEYLLSDQSRAVIVYSQPIHYETENGQLAEIDNTLTKTEAGYENGSNSYSLIITDNEESQGEVIYKENDYEISWQMLEFTEDVTDGDASDRDATDGDETGAADISGGNAGATDGDGTGTADISAGDISDGNISDTDVTSGNTDVTTGNVSGSDVTDGDAADVTPVDADETTLLTVVTPGLNAELTDETADAPAFDGQEEIFLPSQSRVAFDGYAGGVTVEYAPAGDGVKENIILPARDAGSEYIFSVNMTGLNARLCSNNEIEFYDPLTDEVQYYFPAPFLIDAEGILSYDAHYELAHSLEEFGAKDADVSGTTDGGDVSGSTDGSDRSENSTPDDAAESDEDAIFTGLVYIRIAIDEDWLDQAAYPVTVDPVLKQARVKNLLDYGCVDSDGNLYDTLYVGAKINAKQNINTVYRSFVRFDLPDLPSQSVVTEALLYLGGSAAEGNTHYLQTHMAEKGWYHKAEPGSDEAGNAEAGNTGAESPVPLSWSEQPGRGQLLDYALNAGYFNITKAVRKWADGANNYGIVFSAYDETKNTKDTIRLKNDAAKPYLKVTYRTTTGLESYWSTHTTGAGTAGAGFINDYTGSLTVVNTAVATAGERMPMSISHVYNSTMTGEGAEGWRLNYAQTLRIPLDTVDVAAYPYLYTDADGTLLQEKGYLLSLKRPGKRNIRQHSRPLLTGRGRFNALCAAGEHFALK